MNRIVREEFDYKLNKNVTYDYIKQNNHKRINNKHFRKSFDDLFEVLSYLSGSEPKVLSYLLLNCNSMNQIVITQKKLAKKVNLSLGSIKKIIAKFKELNIIYVSKGIITINPCMFVKDGKLESTLQITYIGMFNKELQ